MPWRVSPLPRFVVRELALERRADRVELRVGLRHRHAGLEPAAHEQPDRLAAIVNRSAPSRGDASGVAEIGTHASLRMIVVPWKPGGVTPTMVKGWPLSGTVSADDVGRAAEAALPQLVADHRHRVAARRPLVVGVDEQPAGVRRACRAPRSNCALTIAP